MDPNATLREMHYILHSDMTDADWDRLDELRDAMREWLDKGGFEPNGEEYRDAWQDFQEWKTAREESVPRTDREIIAGACAAVRAKRGIGEPSFREPDLSNGGVVRIGQAGVRVDAAGRPIAPPDVLPVIFRIWCGDVIALFPTRRPDSVTEPLCMSYQHVGQHGHASLALTQEGRPATPAEYADLMAEIRSIYEAEGDCVLKVIRRRPPVGYVPRRYKRLYVGMANGGACRELFRHAGEPTPATCPKYAAVMGPFRTKAGAFLFKNSPNIAGTVAEYERLARRHAGAH